MKRTLTLLTAAVLPFGALRTAPPERPAIAHAGTVTCSQVKGTIRFVPGLTDSGGTQGHVSGEFTLHHCKADSGSIPGRATAKISAMVEDACGGIVPVIDFLGLSLSATVWWGIKTIAPSKIAFVGLGTTSSPNVEFTIGGAGNTVSGSYRGADAGASSTAVVTTATSPADLLAKCGSSSGLTSLKVTGGSLHVG